MFCCIAWRRIGSSDLKYVPSLKIRLFGKALLLVLKH